MTKLPLKVSYVLMCDDIRSEASGKNIIIGLYTDNITLPQGSTAFVSPLSFLISGHMPPGSTVNLEAWIEGPNGDRCGEGKFGRVEFPADAGRRPTIIIWRLYPWNSGSLGHFKVHLVQDGHDEVVFEFEVEDSIL